MQNNLKLPCVIYCFVSIFSAGTNSFCLDDFNQNKALFKTAVQIRLYNFIIEKDLSFFGGDHFHLTSKGNESKRKRIICYLPTRWSIKINGSKFKNLILQRLRETGRLFSVENILVLNVPQWQWTTCYEASRWYPKIQELNVIDFRKEDLSS